LLQAQLLLEVGRFEDAENKLLQLTQAEPEIAGPAHSLIARANITVDEKKAAKHSQLAESLPPQTAEAYYLRGMTAASPEEAITWLSQALELDSRHHSARKARAFAYSSVKAFQQMAEDANVLVVLRPHDYLGYALRAIARRENGQLVEAVKDHTQAIRLCPNSDELSRLYNQRRKTHMRSGNYRAALEDAEQNSALKSGEDRFPVFCALLALGEYDKAQAEYKRVAKKGTRPARFFKASVEEYAFELLSTGQSLDLPADIAVKSPFYFLDQAADFYDLLKKKARPLATRSQAWLGDWSLDGLQIAYGRYGAFSWLPGTLEGITPRHRKSFIEIMELGSGKTHQISQFGLNPVWSPNGKYVAFTNYYGKDKSKTDIWLVSLSDDKLRKLVANASKPSWSRVPDQILFRDRTNMTVSSIAIDLPEAKPSHLFEFTENFRNFAISPNEEFIGILSPFGIRVQTFPEGNEVFSWSSPWPLDGWATQLQWHPNSRTLILNSTSYYNQMGICLLDVEQSKATHVFNLTRPWCRTMWSPDGSQLIVQTYAGKILWLMDIDPERPLGEVLAPSVTTDEFLAMLLERWDQRITTDPLCSEHYVSRALVLTAAKDYDRARHDINQCIALINDPNDPAHHAIAHWARIYEPKQNVETELWCLAHAQLAERFPEHFRRYKLHSHPYQRLIQIYDRKGEKQKQIEWQKKWQEIQDSEHTFTG
jgi:tetratricopeptide (TPR) repeat protein